MDQYIKKLDNLNVLDLTMTISVGGHTLCGSGWSGKEVRIEHASIYYPTQGRGWVVIGKQRVILNPKSLYFIPPHVEVSFAASPTMTVDWLHFHPQSLQLLRRLGTHRGVFVFGKRTAQRWGPVCRRIGRLIKEKSVGDACRIQAMLLELVGIVLDRLPEESVATSVAFERLLPVIRYLDANATRHPSLAELARIASLSPEYFHRFFRELFHITPFQYASDRRMALAQQLLAEGRFSIAQIAEQCGYDDPFYFSRVFRRRFGLAPGKAKQSRPIVLMP